MKNLLGLLLIFSFAISAEAQLDCSRQLRCRITAPSGMRMRSKPSLKASPVTSVPYDSTLSACETTFGAMSYEGIDGFWRKVDYKGKTGYMFDGFLEVISLDGQKKIAFEKLNELGDSSFITTVDSSTLAKAIPAEKTIATTTASSVFNILTEAYNYCGDVSKLDPGLLWYGFYPASEKESGGNITIQPVELDVVMSKTKVGKKLEFDIETKNEERSIFLLGLNRPLDIKKIDIKDHSKNLRFSDHKVFPGQELQLNTAQGLPITLAATGTVASSGPCPELKNYKLLLKGAKYSKSITQDLTKEIVYTGQCGMPEIYWYGDFTGDGVPEIIFVSVYDEKNHFTLFLSDPTREDILVRKEAEWIIDKCY